MIQKYKICIDNITIGIANIMFYYKLQANKKHNHS